MAAVSIPGRLPWQDDDPITFDALEVLLARPAWHGDALCREYPAALFFPATGQPTAPAKAVCHACLVEGECRAWAADQPLDLAGVWGGLSARQRRQGADTADRQAAAAVAAAEERTATVVGLARQGVGTVEIGLRLGCSSRTVKRDLAAARARSTEPGGSVPDRIVGLDGKGDDGLDLDDIIRQGIAQGLLDPDDLAALFG